MAFAANILDSALYAVGTRVFSDALPSHLARRFSLSVGDGEAKISIDPEAGSAPALVAQFERLGTPALPEVFSEFAESWAEAVRLLTCQDAAVVWASDVQRIAIATISLPVDIPSVQPLRLRDDTLQCQTLKGLGARSQSLCFLLPSVHFQALNERLL